MRDIDELVDIDVASVTLLLGLGDVLEIGVLAIDEQSVIQGCNGWLSKAMGPVSRAVVGQSIYDVFRGLVGSPAQGAIESALEGVTAVWSHSFHSYLLELPPPVGHGEFECMQQSAKLLPVRRNGVVGGAVLLIQDVTERVSRERALEQAVQNAEVSSQAKSDFLASMSHELRTPLSAIIGYMDLLLNDIVGPVQPLQKVYLGRVAVAGRHLVHIIEEILTFSRVEVGKEPVYIDDVDVVAILRDVQELLEPQASQKNVALTFDAPAEAIILPTDATKIRQIILNLVGNAVKFTDAGRVAMEMTRLPDRVMVRISDTGPGIPLADTERVFEPFTQVDQSLRRTKGGTGLGLPVSRRLAHLLQGELTVERTGGDGTTFALWLPLVMTTSATPD